MYSHRINFDTPTQISSLDITSMGDSVKRGDETKIGTFDSGLKYSIAILLRLGVTIRITTYQDGVVQNEFRFGSTVKKDAHTGKEKELIVVHNHGETITTGFALNLGFDWKPWMALREIYSNMLDEDGHITEDGEVILDGTRVTLEYDEDNPFKEVWDNKDNYILDESKYKTYVLDKKNTAIVAPEGSQTLRIFKGGILVYESDTTSEFWFNVDYGRIDEMRVLSEVSSVNTTIKSSVFRTSNIEFLENIISSQPVNEGSFLAGHYNGWDSPSEYIFKMCHDVAEKYGEVHTYSWIMAKIKSREDCKLPGRRLTTVSDSLWDYSRDITIEGSEVGNVFKEEGKRTLLDKIKEKYHFDFEVEIVETKLSGGVAVADKYNKVLLVDYNFDVEEDMPTLLVEAIDLTMEGNVLKNLSKVLVDKLKK